MPREPRHVVDVDAVRSNGFCLVTAARPFVSEWHAHRKHQLLYSTRGTLLLEVEGGQWALPPQRAALIASKVRHRVAAKGPSELCTVYLAPTLLKPAPPACVVFAVDSLAQEMIRYSARWGHDRAGTDRTANLYFQALAALVPEWARQALPFHLPVAKSAELQRAMGKVLAEFGEDLSLDEVARVAAVSPRTLARRFESEVHMGFRTFVRLVRIHRAMELLARPQARVTEVAQACGFDSLSAFTTAFVEVVRERPKDFRRRVQSPVPAGERSSA